MKLELDISLEKFVTTVVTGCPGDIGLAENHCEEFDGCEGQCRKCWMDALKGKCEE